MDRLHRDGFAGSDVALGNCYYDALKVVLGCTAFAVDTGDEILHARNLDWWTENAALARYTTVCILRVVRLAPSPQLVGPACGRVFRHRSGPLRADPQCRA